MFEDYSTVDLLNANLEKLGTVPGNVKPERTDRYI